MPGAIRQPNESIDEDTMHDILYLARIGELAELKALLTEVANDRQLPSTVSILYASRDAVTGNCAAHLAAANGHVDVLSYIHELDAGLLGLEVHSDATLDGSEDSTRNTPVSLLTSPNLSGNTPLHYAALNGALEAAKILVSSIPSSDSSMREAFVKVKNHAGKTAIFEAEIAGKESLVSFLLGVVDDSKNVSGSGGEETNAYLQQDEADVEARDVAEEVKRLNWEDT